MTPPNATPTSPIASTLVEPPRRNAIATGSRRIDATSGIARRTPGIPGVCRRWTPSGVTTTRRSATTAAPTPTTGMRRSSTSAGPSGGTIDAGNHVALSSGIFATNGRVSRNSPIPATTPMIVTNSASTAARAVTCEPVAPTRRSAASRCSRRAADSRVAVETKTATGTSAPITASTIIRIAIGGMSGVGGVVSKPVIGDAPISAKAAESRPTIATSSSGERRPASPTVPTTVPIRSPSWSAGTSFMRAASAGETTASPGPGSRSTPGGVGGSAVSPATSTRTIGWPWYSSTSERISRSAPAAVPSGVRMKLDRHAARSARSSRAGRNDRANSRIAVPVATANAVSASPIAAPRPPLSASRSPSRITARPPR